MQLFLEKPLSACEIMSAQPAAKLHFPLLDILRGPAALLVFAEHWRNLFFKDFAELSNPGALMKGFYVLTGAGNEAVMIFLVLSGCVIAHAIRTMRQRDAWSWRSYLSSRLTRLWIVLIPALVLTACWDQLGMWLGGSNSIYTGTGFGHILNDPVAQNSTLLVFLGNLAFLQKILVSVFGSNGPLWVLSYMVVYYIVYAALVVALAGRDLRWWTRAVSLIGAIGVLVFCGASIALLFPVWLSGVAAYWFFVRSPFPARAAVPGFLFGVVLLAGCIVGSRAGIDLGCVNWVWLVGASCAVAVYCGLSAKPSDRLTRWTRPLKPLSAVSYSVYLLHVPILVFVASLLFQDNADRWNPNGRHFAIAIPIAVVTLGYCVFVWYFTERRTTDLRRWLMSARPRG